MNKNWNTSPKRDQYHARFSLPRGSRVSVMVTTKDGGEYLTHIGWANGNVGSATLQEGDLSISTNLDQPPIFTTQD